MTKAWPVTGIEPNESLDANARRILAVRVAEFYSYAGIVEDEHANRELHDLRIAAKRLRYTLELFRSAFGEVGEVQIERVKDVQERLGQIHDHDVRIELVEDELNVLAFEQNAALSYELSRTRNSEHDAIITAAFRPPPDDPRRGLMRLLGRQYGSRHKAYEGFLAAWRTYADDGMRAALVNLTLSTPDEAGS